MIAASVHIYSSHEIQLAHVQELNHSQKHQDVDCQRNFGIIDHVESYTRYLYQQRCAYVCSDDLLVGF
jgi:hypothetical protein